MSNKSNHSGPNKEKTFQGLSEEDILGYLNGQLEAKEMHRIEREALDDDFDAEALEGLSSLSAEGFETDMATLSARLEKRIAKEKPKKKLLLWPRWAAAIAVFALASWGIVYLVNTDALNKEGSLALEEHRTEESRPESAPLAEDDKTTKKQSTKEEEAPLLLPPEDSDDVAREDRPDKHHDSHSYPPETVAIVDEMIQAEEALETEAATNPVEEKIGKARAPVEEVGILQQQQKSSRSSSNSEEKTLPENSRMIGPTATRSEAAEEFRQEALNRKSSKSKRQKSTSDAQAPNVVEGKVTTADGEGIRGVNVLLQGSTIGTTTDIEGNYSLEIPSNADESTLEFSYIGYTSQKISPSKASATVNVQMEEDSQVLSEVVFANRRSQSRDAKAKQDHLELTVAEPVGGRGDFNRYLKTALRYPQAALDQRVEGKVTVEFTVQEDGSLTGLRVRRGLGHGCDEEALRLIRSGPAWKPARREGKVTSDQIRVKVPFRLP